MGIPAYKLNNLVCAHFSQIETSASYFPIIRTENWENLPYKLFDSTATGTCNFDMF
jgi:hypothetical protein